MAWTFALSTAGGGDLGDLIEAKTRQVRFPLNRVPTAAFTVRRDNPRILDLLQADKTLVKVYEDYTTPGSAIPRFVGPITSVQKVSGDESTLAITASGPGWRLGKRLVGKNKTGVTYGTSGAPVDRGTIAWNAITDARIDFLGGDNDHGIRQGTIIPSAATSIGPLYFTPALQVINDLSAALDGFDWEIAPIEPVADAQGVEIGVFNCAPVIGAVKQDALFEYGAETRRSAKGFEHQLLPEGNCNWAFHLPPGFPDSTQDIVHDHDTASIGDRGLYEDVVQSDVQVDALRTKLVQEHVRIRRYPRQIIKFTPTVQDLAYPGRVPTLFTEYTVGDIVPFRAVEEGVTTVDAMFRVFAVTLELDQEGGVIPTLDFVQEDS